MRRAYLGPKLEELASGALPDAFEADERATPDCPDLLQLVSGRQLLGAVRERRLELLARQAAAAAALHEGRQAAAAGALPAAAGAVAAGGEQQEMEQQHCEQVLFSSGQAQREEQQSTRQQQQAPGQQLQQQQRRQRDPDILDLFVGDELVASAVRHFPGQHPPNAPPQHAQGAPASSAAASGATPGSSSSDGSGGGSGGSGRASSAPQDPGGGESGSMGAGLPAEVIGIYDRAGQLLAQVRGRGAWCREVWRGCGCGHGLYCSPKQSNNMHSAHPATLCTTAPNHALQCPIN